MDYSKIRNDFRLWFVRIYFLISIVILIILFLIYADRYKTSTSLNDITFLYKAFWCLPYTLLGFCLLVIKVSINNVHRTDIQLTDEQKLIEEIEKHKKRWRYRLFYPIMLIVLSLLAVTLSLQLYTKDKLTYFLFSSIISFFLGYFVDSLPGIIEKLGDKLKPDS